MPDTATCDRCGQGYPADLASEGQDDRVLCPDCKAKEARMATIKAAIVKIEDGIALLDSLPLTADEAALVEDLREAMIEVSFLDAEDEEEDA